MRHLTSASTVSLALALASPAFAQETPAAVTTSAEGAQDQPAPTTSADESLVSEGNEILVVATRLRGAVEAPQPPVITLEEADIAAYGASSVADLITALSPQTSSGRGRGSGFPVILVNGQRIGSFREMRNFPPESIRRVEVLPEEVALRYGFAANQRVVNLILKDQYASRSVEGEWGMPDRGGFSSSEYQASLFSIAGQRRLNVTASLNDTSPLTEAERGVIPTTGAVPGSDAYRTLVADSRELQLGVNFTTALGKAPNSPQLSANAQIVRSDTRSLSGLDGVVLTATGALDPLERIGRTVTVNGGAGLNLPLGSWQLNTTVDASHSETDTRIDRRADVIANAGIVDRALTDSNSATVLSTLIGRPFRLPAGEVSTTLKAGFAYTGIESDDTRSAVGTTRLTRGDLSAGINVGIPIASRRENALAAIGDLNLNFSAGINRLSDFGTLKDWSAGLTWSPTEKLGFQASYLVNEAAPSLADLGNPLVTTFNVPVYDFTRGTSTLITVISGGNRALVRETQRDLKFGVNWQLPFLKNSNFIAEYFRNNSDDVTASFPVLTPAIEAAFPGRVVRDGAGNLVSIDRRSVTFAETSSARLRYGFNVSGTLGKASGERGGMFGAMDGGGGRPRGGGDGGRGPGGGGGMGAGGPMGGLMGGGGGQGRWNLSVYHTVKFTDQVLIAPGGPVLDLLNGDALSGGGTSRHVLELEGGGFYKGFGLRLNGTWSAPTTVEAAGIPGSSDLRFGSVTKLNLRLFADLGQQKKLTRAVPFFKGSRLSLNVENVFDSRQRVTDGTGTVPLSYQPDYLDPRGRFIELEFRKMF